MASKHQPQPSLDDVLLEHGLGHRELERKTGVPRMTLLRLRQGLIKTPRTSTLKPLAKELRKPVSFVLAACRESYRRAHAA